MCGGGGIISDFVSSVGDAFSGVGDALASIDPGPALGDAGAAIDNTVNDLIPGGWATVGAAALAVATDGASLALDSGLEAGALAAESMGPTIAELGAEAATTGLGETALAGAEAFGPTAAELGVQAGPTYGELGYTGLEAGQMGPTYAELGVQGINSGADIAAADAAAAAEAAKQGLTGAEALKYVNNARQVYNAGKTVNSILNPPSPPVKTQLLSKPVVNGSLPVSPKVNAPTNLNANSNVSSNGSGLPSSGLNNKGLPGYLTPGVLTSSSPQANSNPQLQQLIQLHPQLSSVDPRILSSLMGSTKPQGYKLGGVVGYANGGHAEHVPEFITGKTGHHVKGRGTGQSDEIPAMLANDEYVLDADSVASLGDGSSEAGAKFLDHFRESIRKHKRSAPTDKIPPKASPLQYVKEAMKKSRMT